MSQPTKVRCYQYVNRPYGSVREVLRERAPELLRLATTSAAARASHVGASLHVDLGGLDVGVEIRVTVVGIRDEPGIAGVSPVTRLAITWEATHARALFPVMKADLSLWPLSSTETQLEIEGEYRPPFSVIGAAGDAVVGRRVAEATVHRFLDDVAERLRSEIPGA
jgi:hypothetical protein